MMVADSWLRDVLGIVGSLDLAGHSGGSMGGNLEVPRTRRCAGRHKMADCGRCPASYAGLKAGEAELEASGSDRWSFTRSSWLATRQQRRASMQRIPRPSSLY